MIFKIVSRFSHKLSKILLREFFTSCIQCAEQISNKVVFKDFETVVFVLGPTDKLRMSTLTVEVLLGSRERNVRSICSKKKYEWWFTN